MLKRTDANGVCVIDGLDVRDLILDHSRCARLLGNRHNAP
jgi:hypothetical protein